jgi:putative MFS transporter
MTSVSARLDRLPITSIHRNAIVALAFAYFFELSDISTFAYAAPSLVQQWHLSVHAIATITSAGFAGMFVGALAGGRFADLAGRRRALVISILIYTVASLCTASAWDTTSMLVCRFVTGIGLAMTVVANTYVSEVFPAAARGRYLSVILTIGLLGIPATAWVARLVVPVAPLGWRLIFLWGGLGIVSLIFVRRMPESPRWLLQRKRSGEAEAALEQFEAAARAQYGALAAPDPSQADQAHRHHVPYRELFVPGQRANTLTLIVVWVFQTVGAYGFLAWVPTLLVDHGFSIVRSLTFTSVIAICNPIGALVASFLVERIDRKWYITFNAIAVAVFGLLYGFTFEPARIMLFGALVVMGLQSFVAAIYAYTPELFPTRLRASGHGLVYGLGRLANVVGPLVVSALYASMGYKSVFVYITVCWLVAALAVGMFGPLTSKRPLEAITRQETEGEADHETEHKFDNARSAHVFRR